MPPSVANGGFAGAASMSYATSYATLLLAQGVDLRVIMELLYCYSVATQGPGRVVRGPF